MNALKIIQVENNTDHPLETVILPDNSLIVGIQFGNPVYEIINGNKVALPRVSFCGQLTHKKEYVREPGSKTLLIKFRPWEADQFIYGLPELTDRNISCSDFSEVTELSFDTVEKTDIIEFLDGFLGMKVIDKSILQSIRLITENRGQIKVNDLAYQVCNSRRNFERKFKETTGLTPKEYIKNTRLDYSVRRLRSSADFTGISFECGYYDQPHFIHDFKNVTGVTPENYVKLIQPIENWALAERAVF